jgi:hypothetical protein
MILVLEQRTPTRMSISMIIVCLKIVSDKEIPPKNNIYIYKTAEGGIPGSRGMLSPLRRGVRGEAEPLLKSSVTSEAMSHGCLTSIPLGLTDEIIIDIYLQK